MFKRKSVIFSLVTIVLLVFTICGCQKADGNSAKNDQYELVIEDGNYYLKFHNESENMGSDPGLVAAPTVYFDSVEEMKNDILTNNFTADEFREIHRMTSEKFFQLFDLNNLIEPEYPSVFDDYSVLWHTNTYSFHLDSAQYKPFNNFHTLPKDYAEDLITEFNNFESKETISIQKKTTDESNRTILEYYVPRTNAHVKRVAYTLSTETKTLYIVESVSPNDYYSNPHLTIIGNDNGVYFRVTIDNYTEPLTDDQLLKFGIREYVDSKNS